MLISDDASTDVTPVILQEWRARDSRLRVIRQAKNLGLFQNFSFVCEQTDTPWLVFAAHDDLWSPDFLERTLETALAHPGCELVAPRVVMKDMRRGRQRVVTPPPEVNETEGDIRIRLLLKHAAGTWIHGLFRRSVVAATFQRLRTYGYAWGIDPLLLLPILLGGQVWAEDRAVFYAIDRGNRDSHKPRSYAQQHVLYRSYIIHAWRLWKETPMNGKQRLRLFPHFLRYVHRHGCKVRRLLLSTLMATLSSGR